MDYRWHVLKLHQDARSARQSSPVQIRDIDIPASSQYIEALLHAINEFTTANPSPIVTNGHRFDFVPHPDLSPDSHPISKLIDHDIADSVTRDDWHYVTTVADPGKCPQTTIWSTVAGRAVAKIRWFNLATWVDISDVYTGNVTNIFIPTSHK